MENFTCYIKPLPGEQTETDILLPPASTALIFGTLRTSRGDPLPDTLVLLLGKEDGVPLLQTVTDEWGRFYLGPVQADTLYILRAQPCRLDRRILELTLPS